MGKVEAEVSVAGIIESLAEVEETLAEQLDWELLLFFMLLMVRHY